MKITIRIPTTQFAFIEAEGTEKDLPEMIKMHNLYCQEELKPRLECASCGTIMKTSKAGNLYCPKCVIPKKVEKKEEIKEVNKSKANEKPEDWAF